MTNEEKIKGAKMIAAKSVLRSNLSEYRGRFRLIGLSKPFSMTCTPLENENIFWPKISFPKDRFEQLFKYMEGETWEEPKYVIIAHEGINEDKTPINGVVISMEL